MTDFGGKLRLARERRGVSLRQIAASTKISVAALEALERNDLSRLPGGIFSRAFVRSYAVEVGLDPDATVREFLERFHDGADPSAPQPGAAAVDVRGDPDEEEAFQSRQRMARVLLKIIVASFVIAAVILYLTRRQTTALPRSADKPLTIERTPTRGASLQDPWTPDSVRL